MQLTYINQAVQALYPRVVLDLTLFGEVDSCEETLRSLSCVRSCHLIMYDTSSPSPTLAILQASSLECLHKQVQLEYLSMTGPETESLVLPMSKDHSSPLGLDQLFLENDILCPSKTRLQDYFDFNTLRVVTITGFQHLEPMWQQPQHAMPNLESVRIVASKRPDFSQPHPLMIDSHISVMHDFFSSAKLCRISFHGFIQTLPWLDLVSSSGTRLRELSIYTAPSYWSWGSSFITSPELPPLGSTPYAQYLQIDRRPGFTHTELLQLSSLCPNIENLGFDVHDMELGDAVCREHNPFPITLFRPILTR